MHDGETVVSGFGRRGVKLWTDDRRLHFSAPKGVLSADDLERLRVHKKEVIEALEQAELARGVPDQLRPTDAPVPLTALQMRKWHHIVANEGGLSERTCFGAQRVIGPLDVAALRTTLQVLVERHGALRIGFVLIEGTPRQQVARERRVELELVDLSSRYAGDASIARELCERFVKEKIDLLVGPLFAAKLFKLSAYEHVFIFVLDHMISDAVSCQILTSEVWEMYRRAAQGLLCTAQALPLQFPDFVSWQHRTRGAWLAKHGEYWTKRMAGARRHQTSVQANPRVSGVRRVAFDVALSARLRDLARRERSLPALVVLAIFAAAASRWLRQNDFVLAFVSNGRDRPELQNMIGFLADYLHLRIRTDEADSFVNLLQRLTAEFHLAYEHQDYGRVPDLIPECLPRLAFNWIADACARDGGDAPAVDDTLRMEPFPLQLAFPLPQPVEIALLVSDTGSELVGGVYYRPDIFMAPAIEQLADSLVSLAEEASLRPRHRY